MRFWAKVDKSSHPNGCWLWTARNIKGYGDFYVSSTRPHALATRYSWEIARGPVPDGLCVLHACDNPPCVNPDHLWLGTHDDNMRDMAEKGRHNPWEKSKTHCPRGHEYSGANLKVGAKGVRSCRACRRIASALYRARQGVLRAFAFGAEIRQW